MIPKFGPTGKLRQGEHDASWSEIERRLGSSPKRRVLLAGLLQAARLLAAAGVLQLYIDGSFATDRRNPGDFDCCYDLGGVEFDALPDVFRDFSNERAEQKRLFGGELFPSTFPAGGSPPEPYLTFFQHDKAGRAKGIIVLDLGTLP